MTFCTSSTTQGPVAAAAASRAFDFGSKLTRLVLETEKCGGVLVHKSDDAGGQPVAASVDDERRMKFWAAFWSS